MKIAKVTDDGTLVWATLCVMALVFIAALIVMAGVGQLTEAETARAAMREAHQQLGWILIGCAGSVLLVTVPVLLLLMGIYKEARLTRMILQCGHSIEIEGVEAPSKSGDAEPSKA